MSTGFPLGLTEMVILAALAVVVVGTAIAVLVMTTLRGGDRRDRRRDRRHDRRHD